MYNYISTHKDPIYVIFNKLNFYKPMLYLHENVILSEILSHYELFWKYATNL